MSDREIVDLKQFLEKCLEKTVLDYTLSDLTKPGENYGSILRSLEVTVADANDRVSIANHKLQLCNHVFCFHETQFFTFESVKCSIWSSNQ